MSTSGRLVLVSLLLQPIIVHADAWYELIRYSCDKKGDSVRVEYVGAYNEQGEVMKKNKGPNEWNPWELVTGDNGSDGRYIKGEKLIRKVCALSDGKYLVEFGPSPCNSDTQGMGGAMMMARAKITRQGKTIGTARFGGCTIGDNRVTTSITIRPGKPPIIEEKAAQDYFQ